MSAAGLKVIMSSRLKNKTLLLAAACLFCAATAGDAFADKRVVILDFDGRGSNRIKNQVGRIIAQQHEAISGRRYVRAARRMNARRPTPRNVRRVCARVGVDGIVSGEVQRRRRRYVLKLRLRSGESGEFVKTITVRLGRKPRLSAKNRRRIRRQLLRAVDNLSPVRRGDRNAGARDRDDRRDENEERFAEDEPGSDFESDDDSDFSDEDDSDVGDDDSFDDDGGDDSSASLTDAERADLAVRGRPVEVWGGVSFIGRNLTFTAAEGLMDPPQSYEGGLVPGILVAAEVYPLAFGEPSRSFTHNIGISAMINKVVKIESRVSGMEEVALPTSQSRFGVGVVYRHNFGDDPSSPTVKASVRFNKRAFAIDTSDSPVAIDVPDVSYTYLDPGLLLHFPIIDKLAAIAEARFLLITSTGEIQDQASYGTASMLGIDGALTLEYTLTDALAARAGARIASISYTFEGDGELSNNRDGDPMSVDVSGARDRYLGFFVGLGYNF